MSLSRGASTITWGVYCTCSWTWCIGMFLPLLMLQRYGIAGFLAFAIPNVIGCAAFGYVLRDGSRSRSLIERHGVAATCFSVVTITYHLFFAVFFITELLPSGATDAAGLTVSHALPQLALPDGATRSIIWPLLAVAALYGAGGLISTVKDRIAPWIAVIVYGLSIGGLIVAMGGEHVELEPIINGPALVAITPVIVFGFLLCPYLDLTFHRALQQSPSRHSFGVFGVTFAVMIIMTCVMWSLTGASKIVQLLVVGHVAAQSVFTVGIHLRELWRQSAIACPKRKLALTLLPAAVAIGYALIRLALDNPDIGEAVYLRILGFYGLVFPLYVWVLIGPGRPVERSRSSLVWFGLVILLCAPLYEAGFIHGITWLTLIPAAGFAAWPLVRRNRADNANINSAS